MSLGGDAFEAEGGGSVVEAAELLAFHFFLLFAEHLGVEDLPLFEQVPELMNANFS